MRHPGGSPSPSHCWCVHVCVYVHVCLCSYAFAFVICCQNKESVTMTMIVTACVCNTAQVKECSAQDFTALTESPQIVTLDFGKAQTCKNSPKSRFAADPTFSLFKIDRGSPNSHFLLISMIKGSSAGAETWIFGCS
jgi:hypothetical protein